MIEWTALTLKNIFEIVVLSAAFLSIFLRIRLNKAAKPVVAGLAASAFFGVLLYGEIIYILPDKTLEEAYIGFFSVVAAIIMVLLTGLWALKQTKILASKFVSVLFSVAIFVFCALLFLPKFIKFSKIMEKIVSQTSMLNSDTLYQIFGVAIGIFVALFVLWAFIGSTEKVKERWVYLFLCLFIIPGAINEAVHTLRLLTLSAVISPSQAGMDLLISLINSQKFLEYLSFGMVAIFLPFSFLSSRRIGIDDVVPANPAIVRKQKASVRRQIRWASALFMALFMTYSVFMANVVVARKGEALISKAVPVKASADGLIKLKTGKLKDKKLHRFSYEISGKKIRFLIIYKGSGVFGVGFDACEICGSDGYYEKDDNVVCKACGSAINKATVGFPGGCNPIPLNHSITKGYLEIPVAGLKKGFKHFEEEGEATE